MAVVIRSVQELEVIDRERGAVTSMAPTLRNFAPAWTPDGQNLVFDAIPRSTDNSYRMGVAQERGIFRVRADGSSEPQLLRVTPQISHVTAVAGDYAAAMVSDPLTNTDLWLMSLHEPYEMKAFKRTSAVERQGALSPDGRWMAYSSNDSGRTEIYVEPVPGPGGRRQISSRAVTSRDG